MNAVHVRRAIVVPVAVVAGLLVLFVGGVGFAHTRPGRPLLAVIGRTFGRTFGPAFRGGSCPLGYDKKATPAEHQQAAARFSAAHRGTSPAAARPALGFSLNQTRRPEVLSLLAAHGISCAPGAADLVCPNVPSAALPVAVHGGPTRELWFTFGAADQLLSVVALSRDAAPLAISDAFAQATQAVAHQAGPATTTSGEAGPTYLASGALHQASAEFRFSNYFARARATNMGNGYLLTEEYRALVN